MGRDAARVDWEALSSSARDSALEDNSVTQQEEVMVLEAIFGDDYAVLEPLISGCS
ncbi:MAG: hypothetical protein SGPRY_009833, partial [Prymnesium sp.]